MNKLQEILDDSAATIYCAGQDWSPINSTTHIVDTEVDREIQQIKDLVRRDVIKTYSSYPAHYKVEDVLADQLKAIEEL
jgi:hypothetical protein